MPGGAGQDVKLGFYVGIGLVLAMVVFGVGARIVGKGLGRG